MPPSGSIENDTMQIKIGILEVQGAFQEHKVALMKAQKLLDIETNIQVTEVRHPDHVTDDLDGLIIPGGESTTISLFLKRNGMEEPLRKWMDEDRHVTWGTCAGMILLSKFTENQKQGGQPTLGKLDTVVSRNFFGRQVHSFEAPVTVQEKCLAKTDTDADSFYGVFIRAPAVVEVCDPSVTVLAKLHRPDKNDDVIVAIQQGNVMATAFHPELTEDVRWHLHFLEMVKNAKK